MYWPVYRLESIQQLFDFVFPQASIRHIEEHWEMYPVTLRFPACVMIVAHTQASAPLGHMKTLLTCQSARLNKIKLMRTTPQAYLCTYQLFCKSCHWCKFPLVRRMPYRANPTQHNKRDRYLDSTHYSLNCGSHVTRGGKGAFWMVFAMTPGLFCTLVAPMWCQSSRTIPTMCMANVSYFNYYLTSKEQVSNENECISGWHNFPWTPKKQKKPVIVDVFLGPLSVQELLSWLVSLHLCAITKTCFPSLCIDNLLSLATSRSIQWFHANEG